MVSIKEPYKRQLFAGAGAEIFGPAPAKQIPIKCYKNP
jgi:hypothetical protein